MDTVGKEKETLFCRRVQNEEGACISGMEKRWAIPSTQPVPAHPTGIPGTCPKSCSSIRTVSFFRMRTPSHSPSCRSIWLKRSTSFIGANRPALPQWSPRMRALGSWTSPRITPRCGGFGRYAVRWANLRKVLASIPNGFFAFFKIFRNRFTGQLLDDESGDDQPRIRVRHLLAELRSSPR